MSTECEYVVIGAGVVGLAIAAALAKAGGDVLILERETDFGTATSARNSEVIHAGIYYPAHSLKAELCVRGKQLLFAYCRERHINHRRSGKLIVATSPAQVAQLETIRHKALLNGVDDVTLLSAADACAMEPQLACLAALHSPSTGIIDSHGLMLSLLGEAEQHGAVLATRACVMGVRRNDAVNGFDIKVASPADDKNTGVADASDTTQISTRWLINAAGHGACDIACDLTRDLPGALQDLSRTHQPEAVYSKGNYFCLTGAAPFNRLIYPVPEPGGLGVHITIDLAGRARFGPDVEAVESLDYRVDSARGAGFYKAIRRYWPALPDNSLAPDYAGIRPRVRLGGELQSDFIIHSPDDHGVAGLINLFGIESPGLTASLAIAQKVSDRCLRDRK